MADFLGQLIARSLGRASAMRPRPVGLFESPLPATELVVPPGSEWVADVGGSGIGGNGVGGQEDGATVDGGARTPVPRLPLTHGVPPPPRHRPASAPPVTPARPTRRSDEVPTSSRDGLPLVAAESTERSTASAAPMRGRPLSPSPASTPALPPSPASAPVLAPRPAPTRERSPRPAAQRTHSPQPAQPPHGSRAVVGHLNDPVMPLGSLPAENPPPSHPSAEAATTEHPPGQPLAHGVVARRALLHSAPAGPEASRNPAYPPDQWVTRPAADVLRPAPRAIPPEVGRAALVAAPGTSRSWWPATAPAPAPVAPPTIQVTIGRVEVRASAPAEPARPARPQAAVMSLDQYLAQHGGGSRR